MEALLPITSCTTSGFQITSQPGVRNHHNWESLRLLVCVYLSSRTTGCDLLASESTTGWIGMISTIPFYEALQPNNQPHNQFPPQERVWNLDLSTWLPDALTSDYSALSASLETYLYKNLALVSLTSLHSSILLVFDCPCGLLAVQGLPSPLLLSRPSLV